MQRYQVLVGDQPARGGEVLPYEIDHGFTIDGAAVALIGGRAYCAACNGVGVIAKAGGPYRSTLHGAEMALEGDVVVCDCPVPPALVASRQRFHSVDDREETVGNALPAATVASIWYGEDSVALTNSKKVVDGLVRHPPEALQNDRICPAQTNEKFYEDMMANCERAIYLVNRKIEQLQVWDEVARRDVKYWFGREDVEIRRYLIEGLSRTVAALHELTPKNFVRYSDEFARRIYCRVDPSPEAVAGVCKSDTRNRIIGIARGFCSIPSDSGSVDSQVGTIIHEVTHFDDVFSANDYVYHYRQSAEMAKTDSGRPMKNADSVTGYVMWETFYGI
ncbi:M35 family metallo-endopeptidase [Xylophilus sp. GOD-11R]|uniref:M35 family metallo-endopeptidase n=1 Tax=Xylophilus sp. GOD-11R TaxID=3089814 RepID=UPI00298BCD8A|nr:M35 family metallo-endopeptidase [Xylophilus sp. GOD-11R]WPB57753.1 M35 family metallo-endopeptidase [Xylophilus sp. GOD-11R]